MNPLPRAVLVAATLAALPASALETYTLDSSHTFPSFEVLHLGFSVQRGRFNRTTGKVSLDPAARKGSAEITIDAASIDTGLDKLEEHLRSEDFFDVSKHPSITFRSQRFHFEGDRVKSVEGELTMRGVTRPLTLEARHFHCGPHPMNKKQVCGGDFAATVKRSDFGMKYAVPAVADEVALRIQVEAFRD